jgi:hypothetical protein
VDLNDGNQVDLHLGNSVDLYRGNWVDLIGGNSASDSDCNRTNIENQTFWGFWGNLWEPGLTRPISPNENPFLADRTRFFKLFLALSSINTNK